MWNLSAGQNVPQTVGRNYSGELHLYPVKRHQWRETMMTRTALPALLIFAVAGGIASPQAIAGEEHVMVTPQEVEWQTGPASLEEGSEMAVLFGNPGEEGLFAMRLRFPEEFHIAPHTHPRPEVVTVISGTFYLGTGETADRDEAHALPAGSFFALEPGTPHFAYADSGTVIQLNSIGPWTIEYVDPADDPRQPS
jgi:quercetin dioxygenase-like cupin family protein